MLDKRIAQEVLAAALREGGDFAEIFLEDRLNNTLMRRNDAIEQVSAGRIHGAGVRVFHEMRCIYAYTNHTDRQGLLDCAAQVAAAVRSAPKGIDITLTDKPTANIHEILHAPGDVRHARRLKAMDAAIGGLRAAGAEVAQAIAQYMDSDQRIWLANSEGLFTNDRRVYSRLYCQAVASNGSENQTGFSAPGGMRGIELFEDHLDPEAIGRGAADSAVLMLHAQPCPAGVMPVIIRGGFGGVLFHEACAHSLEATSVAKGTSEFCGKLGQQIATECVTAIDDGTEPNSWGSLNIDDEGEPTQKKILIEKGILKRYMIDKLNGQRMGMPSSGSGRRQDYRFAPTSRMTNTYIAAGDDDDAEMIATMGDGLLATKMGGGSVDPATGMFNFAVEEAFLVKDGKIAQPVRGASLIGRGSEILMKIDRVGRDLSSAQGMCGSLSGSVPTNVGQPSIRIASLTVGGR
ncbi:MAG: TldD/PmbA family protein [Oscillospiraceae bacterium]|jgi:TldD protein|nr:TldD/PmbA family protein [Oscillospiraceae bacterium]